MAELARSAELFSKGVVHIGVGTALVRDAYAWLLRARWSALMGLCAAGYVGLNSAFACAYIAAGDVIQGARPGSFEEEKP